VVGEVGWLAAVSASPWHAVRAHKACSTDKSAEGNVNRLKCAEQGRLIIAVPTSRGPECRALALTSETDQRCREVAHLRRIRCAMHQCNEATLMRAPCGP
jgi:hypothetical protein